MEGGGGKIREKEEDIPWQPLKKSTPPPSIKRGRQCVCVVAYALRTRFECVGKTRILGKGGVGHARLLGT